MQPLTNEEERDLARRARDGDREALHHLVIRHEPLVSSLTRRYRQANIPYEDLRSEGFMGLLHAAARFDPERGTRFATYAKWWVRYFLQRFVTKNRRLVAPRQTRRLRRLRQRLRSVSVRWENEHGTVTAEELAEVLDATVAEILEVQTELSCPDQSIDDPERARRYRSSTPTPEEHLADEQKERVFRTVVEQALAVLSERERAIVRERILTDPARPLRDLGRAFGVSGERIRQIEKVALTKMREALRDSHRPEDIARTRALLAA